MQRAKGLLLVLILVFLPPHYAHSNTDTHSLDPKDPKQISQPLWFWQKDERVDRLCLALKGAVLGVKIASSFVQEGTIGYAEQLAIIDSKAKEWKAITQEIRETLDAKRQAKVYKCADQGQDHIGLNTLYLLGNFIGKIGEAVSPVIGGVIEFALNVVDSVKRLIKSFQKVGTRGCYWYYLAQLTQQGFTEDEAAVTANEICASRSLGIGTSDAVIIQTPIGQPPQVTFINVPNTIEAETPTDWQLGVYDPDVDIIWISFETYINSEWQISDEGEIDMETANSTFNITTTCYPYELGLITKRIILQDASGNESNPYEYRYECVEKGQSPFPTPPVISDRDGDGISDSSDRCPDEWGPSINDGCPIAPTPPVSDRDSDGILDDQDLCPDQWGPALNNGCPLPPPSPPTDIIHCLVGPDSIFDDVEILWILDAWIKYRNYQGCGIPTDIDVIQVLEKWIKQQPIVGPHPQPPSPPPLHSRRDVRILTVEDLILGAAGLSLKSGPDAGYAPGPGDSLIIHQGIYDLKQDTVKVVVENLTIVSWSGPGQTIIKGDGIIFEILAKGTRLGNCPNGGVTIKDGKVGIKISGNASDVVIMCNNIVGNSEFGLDASNLSPGLRVEAVENWWGSASGPEHTKNPGAQGDRIAGNVNFLPFLVEPR